MCLGSHRSKESRKAAAALATTSACAFFNGRRDGNDLVFLACVDEGLFEDKDDDNDDDEEADGDDDDDDEEEELDDDEDDDEKVNLGEEALDADALAAAIALKGKRPRLAAWSR